MLAVAVVARPVARVRGRRAAPPPRATFGARRVAPLARPRRVRVARAASANASDAGSDEDAKTTEAEEKQEEDSTASSSSSSSSSDKAKDATPARPAKGLARLVPAPVRAWFASIPAKQQAERLEALALAADADLEDFVSQDAYMRELAARGMHAECVDRFEARVAASGPGSVVAYLQSLAALDLLDKFDTRMPPPAQLSMAAAGVIRDNPDVDGERATEAVTRAVAVAAAERSELPSMLKDLSKRAEGRPGVVRPPPGRHASSPLHVVISDGAGGFAGSRGGPVAKGGGLINFIFYSVLAVVVGSTAMSAAQKHASKVTNRGADASATSGSGGVSTGASAGGAGGLLPGGDARKLPGMGKSGDGEKPSSFDPKEYNKDELPTKSIKTFDDVKGCDEAKQELQEIVEYLKNPELFTRLGGKLPKGVLLSGPPGTGKTLLARAVAGEAGVPFFYRAGSEFEEMFVGVGSKRVRTLFGAAKKKMPCIVFIDEIDAVGTSRKAFETQSRKTLNQLLTEMDGFEQNEGIIVIAATNIPEQLDPALTRPGRFDRRVHVPNPDIGGRREILAHYLSDKPVEPEVNIESLARGTSGFSGAELFNLVNMAAVQAAVSGETTIGNDRLEWAKDRIVMGVERKSAVLTEESKKLTAYHEAGHAIVALRTPGAMPVHKATIVPRGSALGMVTQLPDKDETSITRKQLLARLDVCMGGRVAEELIFGKDEVTTGALSDLQQATRLATYMVGEVGLSNLVGPVHVDSMSKGGRRATEALVDKEVVQLLRDSHARVTKLLTKHVGDLHALSKDLLAKETLTGLEIQQLLGLAPTPPPAAPERRKKTHAPAPSVPEVVEPADADGGKETDVVVPDIILEVEPVDRKEESKVTA